MTEMIKSGKLCQESGVYQCPVCDKKISLAKGEITPSCEKCGKIVWEQILRL